MSSQPVVRMTGSPEGWWANEDHNRSMLRDTRMILESQLGVNVGDITYLQHKDVARLFQGLIEGYEVFEKSGTPLKKVTSGMLDALKSAVKAFAALEV